MLVVRLGVRLMLGTLCCLAAAGTRADEKAPVPPTRPAAMPDLPPVPDVPPPVVTGTTFPDGRKLYLPLLHAEAKARGLPPEVADAVAHVESGYNSGALGGDGERGMMQVMPPTAAMLGFKGTVAELADPATNIKLGVTYLAGAWKLSGGDLCRTLMKYRAGHNEERMSALSVEYCRRARSHLAAIGSPLASAALPAVDFGPPLAFRPGGGGTFSGGGQGIGAVGVRRVAGRLVRVAPIRNAATSRRFWAGHAARIRAIEARLPWKRGGILART